MTTAWLIVADDLTGAADCAIAYAKNNVATSVIWGEGKAATPAVSINVESRPLTAEQAAERHHRVLKELLQSEAGLYKKIDSTIRGQPAAEIAATMTFLEENGRSGFAVMAPAFPAAGRTTENGSIRVNGAPLEETPIWARDHSYANANLVDILGSVGILAKIIPLDTIRQGANAVSGSIAAARESYGAVICDAITEADLDIVAEATLPMIGDIFWIGSGGLASSLARAGNPPTSSIPVPVPQRRGGILVTVGSLAEASRAAAAQLVASGMIRHTPIHPDAILSDDKTALDGMVASIVDDLSAGKDVLVEVILTTSPDLKRGVQLMDRLAEALKPAAPVTAGFIATGGDTAIALLNHFGINGIHLVDEVESGIPLGLTIGNINIPVITKAGAFGSETTLLRCLERMHLIKQKGSF